jgi:hypothetical protein
MIRFFAGQSEAGVTAGESKQIASAMTTAYRTEGDFPGTFTHISAHGSDWPVRP